ncbi:MAG: hypothetical protein AB1390_12215 [Nitrospirota bacterium]
MFKLIKRIIGLVIAAIIVLLSVSLWRGGEPFRWFGQKSEKAGEVLKNRSEKIGEEADRIREKTESVADTTKKVTNKIRKTGDKLKGLTGSDDGESKGTD